MMILSSLSGRQAKGLNHSSRWQHARVPPRNCMALESSRPVRDLPPFITGHQSENEFVKICEIRVKVPCLCAPASKTHCCVSFCSNLRQPKSPSPCQPTPANASQSSPPTPAAPQPKSRDASQLMPLLSLFSPVQTPRRQINTKTDQKPTEADQKMKSTLDLR
jgi:hypothetical protein